MSFMKYNLPLDAEDVMLLWGILAQHPGIEKCWPRLGRIKGDLEKVIDYMKRPPMSFMDGCKPHGPLEVLTPEEQRVTDHYQRYTTVAEHVAAVIEDCMRGD